MSKSLQRVSCSPAFKAGAISNFLLQRLSAMTGCLEKFSARNFDSSCLFYFFFAGPKKKLQKEKTLTRKGTSMFLLRAADVHVGRAFSNRDG
ncbi:MAG: hypothetical protein IJS69_01805 [Selenomonadaceae bacterium]|nr:hypothetical protein [Selenomonadaceae bacterium]